jgi:hypothetical protein
MLFDVEANMAYPFGTFSEKITVTLASPLSSTSVTDDTLKSGRETNVGGVVKMVVSPTFPRFPFTRWNSVTPDNFLGSPTLLRAVAPLAASFQAETCPMFSAENALAIEANAARALIWRRVFGFLGFEILRPMRLDSEPWSATFASFPAALSNIVLAKLAIFKKI